MFNRRKKKEQKFKIGVSKPRNRFFSFEGKTIWDMFQLLIIPLVLALIAIFFNQAENRRSESIETERVNQNILDNYFGEMTSLLLEKNLRESPQNSEERSVARVLTLSAMQSARCCARAGIYLEVEMVRMSPG
jgi:hypothetical protein